MPSICAKFKANHDVVDACTYHALWCPKYRRDVLKDGADVGLKEIILAVCEECGAAVREMEVMPDHVHLLVDCDPQFGIARLIGLIKGRSSGLLRLEFPWCRTRLPTLWTNSWFVATVGGAPLDVIKRYIELQKSR